jgi:hypothetical protein
MNLVIDDAVEVKMATKDSEETRKELGMVPPSFCTECELTYLQDKSFSRATMLL